jgi:hypothetical protein
MTIIPPFDPLVKLFFHFKDNQQFWPKHVAIFCNNNHCIHYHGVHGEIDGKFART